ncbi:MAG: anthranilate synthase component I [Candidatus Promineifilaceae bacterium]
MIEKTVYRPNLKQFRNLAGHHNLITVVREFPADLETPVTVYVKLMQQMGPSFLLESVEGGEKVGRYSFVGLNPREVIELRGRKIIRSKDGERSERELGGTEDVLDVLKQEVGGYQPAEIPGHPRFIGGAVGYLSYDTVRFYEQRIPNTAERVLDFPEAVFLIADSIVAFDHVQHRLMIMANARITEDVEADYLEAISRIERITERLLRPLPAVPSRIFLRTGKINRTLTSNKTQPEYEAMVRTAKEHIAAGDAFQIVLSQRLERETDAHPFQIYRALRMTNPSPYMFYFDFPEQDMQIVGASPEVMVRLDDGVASVRPIAGTRKRGRTPSEDYEMERDLLDDPKEVAEHVMLIDLGRNDIGRVADYGTVEVSDLMVVERYSHVMHIVSNVSGKLRDGMDAYDLMRATFPAGTLSGAPKVRAMEIIENLEGERRALYGGAVGHFGYDGNMDTCITIRTIVMRGNTLWVQAGAGIVADSDPAKEYEECWNKARALVVAIERAEHGLL